MNLSAVFLFGSFADICWSDGAIFSCDSSSKCQPMFIVFFPTINELLSQLNKSSQDWLVIEYAVIKQATRNIWNYNQVFLQKYIWELCANIVQVILLYNVVSETATLYRLFSSTNIMNQHSTGNFLMPCWPR